MPKTITLYTAMPGTPLVDPQGRPDGTSAAGHMWYEISDGPTQRSYGFAPKEHGASSGPGKGYRTDTDAYQNPHYARTLEITDAQYAKLKEYGEAAVGEQWKYFNGEYKGLSNSCVDFTWGALKHAGGFNIDRPAVTSGEGTEVTPAYSGAIENRFEGQLQPARNKADLEQLAPPVPGSPLNRSQSNPPPDGRSVLQHLISENERSGQPATTHQASQQSSQARQTSPAQQAQMDWFKTTAGPALQGKGFTPEQINTLAAATLAQSAADANKGMGQPVGFMVGKDGDRIAVKYPGDFLQYSEISTEQALAKPAAEHVAQANSIRSSAATHNDNLQQQAGPTTVAATEVREHAAQQM